MSKPIFERTLPVVKGYVEVEDDDGTRRYEATPEQKEKEAQQDAKIKADENSAAESKLLKAQNKALSDRATFLEECLIEMSYEVYQ